MVSTTQFKVDDKVKVRYETLGIPGTVVVVTDVDDEGVTVRFPNGTTEWCTPDELVPAIVWNDG